VRGSRSEEYDSTEIGGYVRFFKIGEYSGDEEIIGYCVEKTEICES
jgi:hypothetical protein